MTADIALPTPRAQTLQAGQIAAAIVGNALDWYDFTIYFYFATTLADLFFPGQDRAEKLLVALAAFGVSYIFRPLGGILFGRFADLHGRKSVLLLLIAFMTAGTALVALAPPYRTIGLLAPCLLVLGRILQGLSASGEFAGASTFLVEHAPPNLRGFFGGWQMSGQGLADVFSAAIGFWIVSSFTAEQTETWAWRLPFLIGLLIGPVGLIIRARLTETPDFLARAGSASPADPVLVAISGYKRRMLIGLGMVVGGAGALYVVDIFMPTYAITTLGLSMQASFIAPLVVGLLMTILCPFFGWLSDRHGRRRVMSTAILLIFLAIYPAFRWLNAEPSIARLAILEIGFGLLASAYAGPFSTAIVELFPVGARATGSAVAYNFGVAMFGGFAPFIVSWFISRTGDPLVPAYYVMAGTLISFVACLCLPEPDRQKA
jgi:MHS family proline/betaine transporter-like MFS transporter